MTRQMSAVTISTIFQQDHMPTYKFLIQTKNKDPRSGGLLRDAHSLGFQSLQSINMQDLYFIEGQLSQEELQQLALKLLIDPVTQSAFWVELPTPLSPSKADVAILEVSLRPGVTDPVAEQLVRAAHEINLHGVHRAATGSRFQIEGLNTREIEALAKQLLANNVIQHWMVGEITPSFPQDAASSGTVETIPLRKLSNDELLALSKERRAALDLAEMQAIQNYYRSEDRDPTDV